MTAPRLVIDLDKITHNTTVLVDRLRARGIAVTGVTKAVLGAPEVAHAMLRGGAVSIADSRVENLERMHAIRTLAQPMLIRSPMLSQVERVVAAADSSCNSEAVVIEALAIAARAHGVRHGIVLMVELGDLREGVAPDGIPALVRRVLAHESLELLGIGTNLACRSGVVPDADNMAELSRLVDTVEQRMRCAIQWVSGGNSANLQWALGPGPVGRVNHLRLGESILLGVDPLGGAPIGGLHTDACVLVGEVIESQRKAVQPRGAVTSTAFGVAPVRTGEGHRTQVLVALGQQDADPVGLTAPPGIEVLGASSDHLVLGLPVGSNDPGPAVGAEMVFGVDYAALLRSATSPFVATEFRSEGAALLHRWAS